MATHFFWDPDEDNIIQERDDTGAITAEYTTEPYLYGNLISQNRGGVVSQYHFDSQGSTLALTDDNQNITDNYDYSAFGEVTEHTGSTINPFQYIGQKGYYFDSEVSQYNVRRRMLQPYWGSWLTHDDMEFIDGPNVYSYVRNRPQYFVDPSGRSIEPPQFPRVPEMPGSLLFNRGCAQSLGSLTVMRETGRKSGTWVPTIRVNVEVQGVAGGRSCSGIKTHTLTVTVFDTIPIGTWGPGLPAAPLTDPVTFASFKVRTTCEMGEPLFRADPIAGKFVIFPFNCFSPCKLLETCPEIRQRCEPQKGKGEISFADELIPPVSFRWTFTPKDLDESCNFDDCDVSGLTLTQN